VRDANDKTIEELTLLAAECLKDAEWHEVRIAKAQEALSGWNEKLSTSYNASKLLREQYGRCIEEIRKRKGDNVNSIGSE
jgi:hypothetical protein